MKVKPHANRSPSSADGWTRCLGYRNNSAPNPATKFGSAVHDCVAEPCLMDGRQAKSLIGNLVHFEGEEMEITAEMAETCQPYLDYVRKWSGALQVEFTLPIGHIVDEPGAVGTPDALLLRPDGLSVIDLKTGNNPRNKVFADGNLQLIIYALAANDYFEFAGNFQNIHLAIVQPRLHHISEAFMTISELNSFRSEIRPAKQITAGEKQCKWCANRKTCEEWASFSSRTVADEFENLSNGGNTM